MSASDTAHAATTEPVGAPNVPTPAPTPMNSTFATFGITGESVGGQLALGPNLGMHHVRRNGILGPELGADSTYVRFSTYDAKGQCNH